MRISVFLLFYLFAHKSICQVSLDSIHYFSKTFPKSGLFVRPDSLPDGVWIAYCETNSSQIGLRLHYKNGKRNGEVLTYWSNGNIRSKGYYKDGRFFGKDEFWYENGTKKYEGIRDSVSRLTISVWLEDGTQSVKDGTGRYFEFHDNGVIQVEEQYLNGLPTGMWTWYRPNGSLLYSETFKEGKRDGKYVMYHSNGTASTKGMYSNGKQVGLWESFYDNGAREEILNRIDGKRDGECKRWHKNGQLSSLGICVLGKEEGIWKFWDEQGKLWMEVKYSKGERVEVNMLK